MVECNCGELRERDGCSLKDMGALEHGHLFRALEGSVEGKGF